MAVLGGLIPVYMAVQSGRGSARRRPGRGRRSGRARSPVGRGRPRPGPGPRPSSGSDRGRSTARIMTTLTPARCRTGPTPNWSAARWTACCWTSTAGGPRKSMTVLPWPLSSPGGPAAGRCTTRAPVSPAHPGSRRHLPLLLLRRHTLTVTWWASSSATPSLVRWLAVFTRPLRFQCLGTRRRTSCGPAGGGSWVSLPRGGLLRRLVGFEMETHEPKNPNTAGRLERGVQL